MRHTLKDNFQIVQNTLLTDRKRTENALHSLSSGFYKHCICRHKYEFREAFADAKVRLSLPTLAKAKLLCPQNNFTYEVSFNCP